MDLEALKRAKREMKMTIAEIAEKANLPKGTVQNIFAGSTPVSCSKKTGLKPVFSCFFGVSRGVFESLPPICPHYFYSKTSLSSVFPLPFRAEIFIFFARKKSKIFPKNA